MTKRWLGSLPWSTLALGLAACSTGSGGANVCPCPVNALTVRYTGSFVQNGAQLPTPIVFTATNETATVTVTTGGSTPAANLSVAFTAPCNAATLGTPTPAGTFTVNSVTSGSCTIVITSSNGTATAGVTVP